MTNKNSKIKSFRIRVNGNWIDIDPNHILSLHDSEYARIEAVEIRELLIREEAKEFLTT